MMSDDTKRISTLTTGAIKSTTESAVKAMLDAVVAAEAKTAEMRAAVEAFIREFEGVTNSLADNVAAHVTHCQAAIDSFQEHHLKILNVDPPEQAQLPPPRNGRSDDFNRLRTMAAVAAATGADDGRKR